ncbi:MAG TPA: hypothetical protein VF058_01225 [Actinomycetota bacterium]
MHPVFVRRQVEIREWLERNKDTAAELRLSILLPLTRGTQPP